MDRLLVARSVRSEYVDVDFWNNFDLFHGAVQCPVRAILEWSEGGCKTAGFISGKQRPFEAGRVTSRSRGERMVQRSPE